MKKISSSGSVSGNHDKLQSLVQPDVDAGSLQVVKNWILQTIKEIYNDPYTKIALRQGCDGAFEINQVNQMIDKKFEVMFDPYFSDKIEKADKTWWNNFSQYKSVKPIYTTKVDDNPYLRYTNRTDEDGCADLAANKAALQEKFEILFSAGGDKPPKIPKGIFTSLTASSKKGLTMKRIAADRNYRITKKAGDPDLVRAGDVLHETISLILPGEQVTEATIRTVQTNMEESLRLIRKVTREISTGQTYSWPTGNGT